MRLYLLICGALFAAGNVWRIVRVLRMPAHLRWELYPMPKGTAARRAYGGSYFEQSEWWTKRVYSSRIAQSRYIAGEVLGFRTVRQRNRPLWLSAWLMHWGVYALIAAALLTVAAAITDAPWTEWIRWIVLLGGSAAIMGSMGLLTSRLSPPLRPASGRRDFFNLVFIAALAFTAVVASSFATAPREVIAFTRYLLGTDSPVSFTLPVRIHLVVVGAFVAYFPFTHMTHAYMKFFAFHRVRWDDTPLVHDARLRRAISQNLARPITWSTPHILATGETWSRVVSRPPDEVGL